MYLKNKCLILININVTLTYLLTYVFTEIEKPFKITTYFQSKIQIVKKNNKKFFKKELTNKHQLSIVNVRPTQSAARERIYMWQRYSGNNEAN